MHVGNVPVRRRRRPPAAARIDTGAREIAATSQKYPAALAANGSEISEDTDPEIACAHVQLRGAAPPQP